MIIRESSNATYDFLNFQIGVEETRPAMKPFYEKTGDGLKLMGYKPTNEKVKVFRLLGYGTSLESAEQMAHRNALHYGVKMST